MPSEKGSAAVPVALFGVSPNSWCGRFQSAFGASGRALQARRRDADESGRDDRAPHLQLHHDLFTPLRFLLPHGLRKKFKNTNFGKTDCHLD
jgi:hypothetical protein